MATVVVLRLQSSHLTKTMSSKLRLSFCLLVELLWFEAWAHSRRKEPKLAANLLQAKPNQNLIEFAPGRLYNEREI